jgi:hypothetical protein
MKTSITSVLLAAAAGSAVAQQITSFNADSLRATSAPNAVAMSTLKQRKNTQRDRDRAAGVFDLDRYEAAASGSPCVDGKAGEYSCNNVDLLGFLRHQDVGSQTREGNDIWGMCLTWSSEIKALYRPFFFFPCVLTKID